MNRIAFDYPLTLQMYVLRSVRNHPHRMSHPDHSATNRASKTIQPGNRLRIGKLEATKEGSSSYPKLKKFTRLIVWVLILGPEKVTLRRASS